MDNPKGGRRRQVAVYQEGPEAARNFLRTMQRIIKAPKQPKKKRAA